MYDIFDDIFDDGYGYDNDYGMSDTDIEVELAYEAAMGAGTNYDYDYATEGFGDVMGKVGTRIADAARNMVRKIGELFQKISQWVKDKLAPLRAKSASSDNKALSQVLKALDRQVQNATGERKAMVKQKVARVKRAIMQMIDGSRRDIAELNRQLSDGVSIFKAAQSIGKSFIEKMNAAVMGGSEKGNTDDGNDLVSKMNDLQRRYAAMVTKINDFFRSDDSHDDLMETITKEMPGSSARFAEIMKAIKWDKVDMRAIFAAEAELHVTCNQGKDAAARLANKLNDKYSGFVKTTNNGTTRYVRNDSLQITKEDQKFDDESRENLQALTLNWNKFAQMQQEMSGKLVDIATAFTKGGAGNGKNTAFYDMGIRKTGRRTEDSELPKTTYNQPTQQELMM